MNTNENTIVVNPEMFGITTEEIKEYLSLKDKIYGNKTVTQRLFMVLDETNADHARYIELSKPMVKIYAYTLANRSQINLNQSWLQKTL